MPLGAAYKFLEEKTMKLENMILVTENCKGTETIFLLNLPDYMAMVLKACEDSAIDMADAISQLYSTKEGKNGCSELYFRANISSQARFCASEGQLRSFLMGIGSEEANEEKPVFDDSRCSEECFEVLKAYGIGTDGHSLLNSLHYEAVAHDFRQGEILHNLNGRDYRVLAVLSEKNLLLMSQPDGQYIVAVNTLMYERSPKEGQVSEDNVIKGVEWGQGVYLGHNLTKIDLDGIIQEYGRPRKINSIGDYRNEERWKFVKLKSMSNNTNLGQTVRWAAEKELMDTFGTVDREIFEKNLDKGSYDNGFHQPGKEKKEKSR